MSTITKWVIAFIEKKASRIKIKYKEKIKLLENQNYKCKLCKREIDLCNSEYDHIISWKLVGDELENNYIKCYVSIVIDVKVVVYYIGL